MSSPAIVNTRTQVGIEVTPGTAVAATQQLAGVMFADTPKINTYQTRRQGHGYPSSSVRGQGMTDLALSSDYCCFNSIVYLLSSLLGAATITTPGGGTDSRAWAFAAKLIDLALGKTLTVERGPTGASAGRKYSYVAIDALTLSGTKDKVYISGGHAFAREINKAVTLTANVPELPCVSMAGVNANVYLDTASANIGTTQLVLSEWSAVFSNFYLPKYDVNRAQTSYDKLVPAVPQIQLTFKVEANSTAWDFFDYLEQGALVYPRIEIIGPLIEAAINHALVIDAAAFVQSNDGFGDDQGVEALTFTGIVSGDPNFGTAPGTALTATVTNKLTSL